MARSPEPQTPLGRRDKDGYCGGMMIGEKTRQAWIKRTADWLEKMSVAAFAVGIFQASLLGIFIGIACYVGSMYLTQKQEVK